MFGSGGIPEVIMADATETVEPSKVSIPGLQSSFVPQGEATLIHQNEKGDLVGPEGSAKSVDEYLYCRLCQAKFEVVKDAMVHYNGEDHKKILIALGKTQANSQHNRASKMPAIADGLESGIFVDDKGCLWGAEKNALTLGEFKRCRLCSVTASSFKTAKEHYNGNKHIKRLKRRAEIEGLEFKSLGKKLYMAVAQGQIERDDDPMGLSEDMRTKVHKDAAAEREAQEKERSEEVEQEGEQEEEGEGVKLEEDMEKATRAFLKENAELHYEGRKHAKMLALKKYGPDLTKNGKPILDLASAGVLYCSSCEVMCITREQLDEHNA
ncbi:putative zinc finger matrin-type protein 3, partial [Apostichopus japonicus]